VDQGSAVELDHLILRQYVNRHPLQCIAVSQHRTSR
jgi:hypothetical protein